MAILSGRFIKVAAAGIGFGIVYAITAKVCLRLAFFAPSASPVWPPAGLAVVGLLVLGYRLWPAIFIGAFFVNLTTAGDLLTSFCIATGNSLEALCAAWLVNRFAGGTRVFERAQDVFKFVTIAICCSAIAATIGPTSLALDGFVQWANYRSVWLTWWLGDLTGFLMFAPLVLLWWIPPRYQQQGKRRAEAIVVLLLLVALCETVFGNWFPEFIKVYPIGFICGPVILWAAFRLTPRETITGVFILSGIALWGTLHGYGPFNLGTKNQSLLLLQAWAGVWTLTSLALAAAMAERRRAEAALEEQKDAVELANRTKDHFLAMLSHELRTPLTPVVAALDLLELETEGRPEVRKTLGAIRRNIELERRLIEDLLDVTRIASGKLKLELTSIDAHEAINDVVEMCRSESATKGLSLRADLKAHATHIMADTAKFKQIIWNLLKNAIKFTPEGGEIIVTTENNERDHLLTSVQDTGIGIESSQVERVFDAFEQGDETFQARNSGLGLGLAISKAIAIGHGGLLEVSSAGRGKGATFCLTMATITLPTATTGREAAGLDNHEQRSWRILLVEDHPDTSAILKNLLVRRGHRVGVAEDMSSALVAARGESYDLLISDFGLPDGSGAELMSQLRSTGLRGIAISGFGMSADVQRSLAAGFSEHLVKPVSLTELEAAIERAMRS